MNDTVLIIDGGYVCAQARFTTGHLESSDKDITGVTFGFLSRLLYLTRYSNSRRFVFAWDARASYRRDAYKEYKETRTKDLTPEEMADRKEYYKQVDRLREEILPLLGFRNSFHQEGVEADDIVALASKMVPYGLIVSADQDLYQLLDDNISMMLPSMKGKPPTIYTKEDFEIEYKMPPSDWWKVKAIMGCASDNVKGVHGIGPVYACRYVRNDLPKETRQYKLIKDNWDIVKRNIPLVKLPHKKTNPISFVEDELSYQNFVKVCEQLEFTSFLEGERSIEWSRLFGDSKKKVRSKLNETRRR